MEFLSSGYVFTTEAQRHRENHEQRYELEITKEFCQYHAASRSLFPRCLCDSAVQELSHSLQRRVPDELVELESQARGDVVSEHPFCKFAGIEQAMRGVTSAASVFGEGGRE
jgi:hypothetical protein